MWDIVGPYALGGLAVIVLSVPAQILVSKLTERFRSRTIKLTGAIAAVLLGAQHARRPAHQDHE